VKEIKKPTMIDSFEIIDLEEKLDFGVWDGACDCGCEIDGGCDCEANAGCSCNGGCGCSVDAACADIKCDGPPNHKLPLNWKEKA
jgi:hypothetical protein